MYGCAEYRFEDGKANLWSSTAGRFRSCCAAGRALSCKAMRWGRRGFRCAPRSQGCVLCCRTGLVMRYIDFGVLGRKSGFQSKARKGNLVDAESVTAEILDLAAGIGFVAASMAA